MRTIVIGGGLAGVAATHRLLIAGFDVALLEASSSLGGLARTQEIDGFLFDFAGHFLHFAVPDSEAYFIAQGVEMEQVERRASVALESCMVPYPLQFNLWAVEPPMRDRVVSDVRRIAWDRHSAGEEPESLHDLLSSTWGPTMVDLFFRPYNEKMWGRRLEELPADCLGRFPPLPNLGLLQRGCTAPVLGSGYNARFWYPRHGGIGAWTKALSRPVEACSRFEWPVQHVDLHSREVTGPRGEIIRYDRLISTIPLPSLLDLCHRSPHDPEQFAHTSIRNVRVGLRGQLRLDDHWLYLPAKEVIAYRINFPSNVNPNVCPPGCASLSIEYMAGRNCRGPTSEHIAFDAIEFLRARDLLDVEEVLTVSEVHLSPAYVVHRSPGRSEFDRIREELDAHGVYVAGRFGTWDYLSMEGAYLSGLRAAEQVIAQGGSLADRRHIQLQPVSRA
jgi:protoporphyrinogen oxidase